MPSLHAQGVSFSHSDAAPLVVAATFHLPTGWTGLVGENGAGKTTLLRLLARQLRPAAGQVRCEPPSAPTVLCPQEVEALDPELQQFAERTDRAAGRLVSRLRLERCPLARWPTLSPGERKRWQLASALCADPDILLLDEPTNHVDAAGREWLVDALRRFPGIGVVVSHDRTLLDALTERTLRLDRGEVQLWSGGYSAARLQWEARAEEALKARQDARQRVARAKTMLDQRHREHQGAVGQLSTRRRMRSRYDSDARGLGASFRAERAEKRLGRAVEVARRQVDRAASSLDRFEHVRQVGRSVFLRYERCPRPWLIHHELEALERGPRRLLEPVALAIAREDRIHLAGPNGAGKSALLETLAELAHVPQGRLLHLPQELSRQHAARALEEVRTLSPDARGQVLSLVAALGVDPDRLLASSAPSPGEARKLLIAAGLGRHAWGLFLDEPTHHLDLPSIERLQAALAAYPGALLLVSHDQAFVRALVKRRWALGNGRLQEEPVEPLQAPGRGEHEHQKPGPPT